MIMTNETIGFMSASTSEPLRSLRTIFTGTDSNPSAVAVSDLNNDGRLDIAVVSSKTNDVLILLADGNGNFVDTTNYSAGNNTALNSIVMGDVDGDKHLDILVANSKTNEIDIFFSYGDGSFTQVQLYRTGDGSEPSSVTIADLNRDNRTAIVVANYGTGSVDILLRTCEPEHSVL